MKPQDIEKQKISEAEKELMKSSDTSTSKEILSRVRNLRSSYLKQFGYEAPPIVPLKELLAEIDIENMPTIEEAVKMNRSTDTDGDDTSEKEFGKGQFTEHASTLLSDFNREGRMAFAEFQDQIFVDLGAGTHALGYRLAERSGAKSYIGVEPFWPDKLREALENGTFLGYEDFNAGCKKIPTAIAPEDMLSFLKRLPDHSVSIFASGIDSAIIDENYKREVENEIKRVLHPKGAFVRNASTLSPKGLDVEMLSIGERKRISCFKQKSKS